MDAHPDDGTCVLETDQISLDVSTTGLAWGTHTCIVAITDPCAANSPTHISVAFNVIGPKIELHHESPLHVIASQNGQIPAPKTMAITNSGGGTLSWTAVSDCDWLAITPNSGSNRIDSTSNATLIVDQEGLPVGRYECHITVSDPNAEVPIAETCLILFV